MKIVLNAYNLKVGGGLNVAFNFIQQLKNYPGDEFIVFAPEHCGYEALQSSNVTIILVPSIYQKYFYRFFLERFWLMKRIKAIKPDVIFTMGNFALPTSMKQALLFHYPYMIYELPDAVKLNAKETALFLLQKRIFRLRLKYAKVIFPQTKVAAERLRKYYGNDLRLKPIPNAYTKLEEQESSQARSKLNLRADSKYLFCLTKYYPHKNVEVLLEVAKLLKTNGSQVKIISTIGADQHAKAKEYIDNIKRLELEEYLINIGPVSLYEIPDLYRETDGLILPTYMESFSATYVDAMYFKKPIFTSDLDFAQEICGPVAYYFDPSNPINIYDVITHAFKKDKEMATRVNEGIERSSRFPDWKEVTNMYVTELKKL